MLFQSLDDKRECIGIYTSGSLYFNDLPAPLTRTWAYSPVCKNLNIEYAQIFSGGKSLSEACPEALKEDYERVSLKMRAYLKSFSKSKIDLSENCFFDMVPYRFLLEFYSVKNSICESIFNSRDKPINHDFLTKVTKMVHEISHQSFEINRKALNSVIASPGALSFRKKVDKPRHYVRYNPYGTVTGRLSTFKNSFPILTMDKKFRNVVVPKNDLLVEVDFNAAELRTLLGLSGIPQPLGDLHTWNMDNIFAKSLTREEAKKKIFSWLYNPEAVNKNAEKYYHRGTLVKKYYNEGSVVTPFGRKIESSSRTALNYLIQSTSSDIFLNSAYRVWDKLSDKKSLVRFLVHDSMLLDVSADEMPLIKQLIDDFADTPLGKYTVGVSAGESYGSMRKI